MIFVCLCSLQTHKKVVFSLVMIHGLIDIELNLNSVTVCMFALFSRLLAKVQNVWIPDSAGTCHVKNHFEELH